MGVEEGTSLDVLFDVPSYGYIQYLENKSYKFYDHETEEYTYGKYIINDSLLIYYYAVENSKIVDTIPVSYFHTFRNSGTMILEIDATAIFRTFIHKKIK